MPKQYVVCGRPVPRLGTRHISFLLVVLALFAILSLLFTLPTVTSSRRLQADRFPIPKSFKSPWMNKLNPFRQPSHPPASQKNDTDGDAWWYADWTWLLMPFSSSVTLDENRALLPMLKERTPVYCYYDNTVEKDRPSRDAESDLLLAWRRAWWAQGFKPIILSPAEAMNNPLYEELQKVEGMTEGLKADLMRWLAWENMGDGLLAHYLLFPMGPYHDPLLTFLRRGEFPRLTKFKGLDDGLFVGSKGEVAAVVKAVMESPSIKTAESLVVAVDSSKKEDPFALDDTPKSLAYYSAARIEKLYAKVGEAITSSRALGLKSLTQLMVSHLHLTWQNTFSDGIAVVKPLPHHTTHLIAPAYELAQRLAHCPESPLPDSCPPNRPNCRPCDDSKPMRITTPSAYSDSHTTYTIGTVPHPYTSSTLNSLKSQLSIPWIRRESPRDAWITSLTSSLFPKTISTTPRLLRFKEAVASDDDVPQEDKTAKGKGTKGGAARSLWLPAEQAIPQDLDWHFGFAIPDRATYADQQAADAATADSSTADPDTKTRDTTGALPPLHSSKEGPLPTQDELALETALLHRAQAIVLSGSKSEPQPRFALGPEAKATSAQDRDKVKKIQVTAADLSLRDATEAWNLADTEAWRFTRAYLARKSVERRRWEEDEARYAGGMGSEKMSSSRSNSNNKAKGKAGAGWGRWLDRRD
ncbi:hypothetical protein VTI74DRAFT_6865 [Chaetomium olivicolor]